VSTPTATDDVALLASELERLHPNLFRHLSRQRWHAAVRELARRAPVLGETELLAGLMRLAALPGGRNGHTGIFPLDERHLRPMHLVPVRGYELGGRMFVIDAFDRALVGRQVTSIAGVPLDELAAAVRPLVSRDNASTVRGRLPHFTLTAEILDGLGYAPAGRAIAIGLDGASSVELQPIESRAYVAAFRDRLGDHNPALLTPAPWPAAIHPRDRRLWMGRLDGGRALYVGYDATTMATAGFARRLAAARTRDAPERVVVDLRRNGGGNNTTYGPLVEVLATPAAARLVVVIGRATFSAAGNLAAELRALRHAVFVGEPSGGGVDQYGDVVPVVLPATGWTVRIPTLYHDRTYGRRRRLAVEPDVAVEPAIEDVLAGRDPVLEAALRA
jgi:Peptidase family S41